MEEESISYEMLQDLLRAERRSNKLTPVPARFWRDVRAFLHELEASFRQEQAKDPFSRRTRLATDQVINSRSAVEGIWALRERKLSMMALGQEEQLKRPPGITPGEADLFDALVEAFRGGRNRMLGDTLGSRAPLAAPVKPTKPDTPATPAPQPAPAGAAQSAAPPSRTEPESTPAPATEAPDEGQADVQPRASEPVAPAPVASSEDAPEAKPEPSLPPVAPLPSSDPDAEQPEPTPMVKVPSDRTGGQDLVVIRALGDIPPFVGPDMQTYLLKEGDIASVPASIANLLSKRSRAVVIDD